MKKESISIKDILWFIIPSLFGVLLLMTPFKYNGMTTVAVSVISKTINQWINAVFPIHYIILLIIFISCVLALCYRLFRPSFIEKNDLLKEISDITIFLAAGFILPFLTEFGLLEFVGVFLTPIMRPFFQLPGRSAVNCVASFIGDGTIGIALTDKQYVEGYYTSREAATISTTFSAVSITFCLVVLQNVGLTDYFGHFYLTVIISSVVCAFIIPYIPPLSRQSNSYYTKPKKETSEVIPDGYNKIEWGLKLAIDKSKANGNMKTFVNNASKTVLSLWFGVMPTIMTVGTIALIISVSTPIFKILGTPFLPFLELLGIPEADIASQTMIVGFSDMVVPSIMAAEIHSEMTRFIVATVSIVQLIYMSETGAVILGSKIPINILELFIIFIERTIISLPIIVLMAHLFF
ncbi:YjiH family protein [Streptococcus agalactiae]|uniref:YjiH family protein n=1 Tax=Streptococcus agalactiae TaxID=1311 RepID=UPI00085C277C|nr:YjiH family protein [Streptococcus agalactiae]